MRNIVSIKNSYAVLQFYISPVLVRRPSFTGIEAKLMSKETKFITFRIIVTAVLELG